MNVTEVEKEVSKLVSDLADCDHDGCLCYEATHIWQTIAVFAQYQLDISESNKKRPAGHVKEK